MVREGIGVCSHVHGRVKKIRKRLGKEGDGGRKKKKDRNGGGVWEGCSARGGKPPGRVEKRGFKVGWVVAGGGVERGLPLLRCGGRGKLH